MLELDLVLDDSPHTHTHFSYRLLLPILSLSPFPADSKIFHRSLSKMPHHIPSANFYLRDKIVKIVTNG